LIEADGASSDPDFLAKMVIALREAKESRGQLAKIRMGHLDHHRITSSARKGTNGTGAKRPMTIVVRTLKTLTFNSTLNLKL
jgi:hypothetical protein